MADDTQVRFESACTASAACDDVLPGYRSSTDKSVFCDSNCNDIKCDASTCGQTVTQSGYTLTCVYTAAEGWHWRDPYIEGYPPSDFCCPSGTPACLLKKVE